MNKTSATGGSGSANSSLGVPVAIVIAGGLIALAIYFGGGRPATVATNTGSGGTGGTQPAATQPAAPAIGDIREVTADDHVRGPADAEITLIEYSDLECPFCKRFHPTMQQVRQEYGDQVRWVYRHFPLDQIHPNARIAAIATECAGEQGKFWELVDYLFENTSTGAELAKAQLPEHARAAGVTNMTAFTACLEEERYADKVEEDLKDAQAAGGRGTPYTVVIGPDGQREAISGAQPFTAVKAVVDRMLNS